MAAADILRQEGFIEGRILGSKFSLPCKHSTDTDIEDLSYDDFTRIREQDPSVNNLCHLVAIFIYIFSVADMAPDKIIAIAEKNMDTDKFELVKKVAENFKNEGIQQGVRHNLSEALEFGLSLRFEDQSQELMKLVSQIQDIAKLREIKEAIINVKNASELRSMLEN